MLTEIKSFFTDSWILVRRNLIYYRRLPQLLVFSSIQPVMFLLLFVYVFGGAIRTGLANYITYLLPGIIVQTVLFGSVQTGVGLAGDLQSGMIDRIKSLPINKAAVLVARTTTDAIRNIFVMLLMTGTGFILGFRLEHSILAFIAALGIGVLFGYAFSWVSAAIGLTVKSVETAQVAGFIWLFPLAFVSSIFVPIDTMPSWLQVFAKHTPITATVNAVRGLVLGTATSNDIVNSLLWIAAIIAIFAPLAARQYHKVA